MKKYLVLILAVFLLLSCTITVFAANNDFEFDVLVGIKAYVTSVDKLDVEVKEGYGIMTFSWTPAEDADMVFSLVDTSVEGMSLTVSQEETEVSAQNGHAAISVVGGAEVLVVVETSDAEAATAVLCGRAVLNGDISNDGKVDTLDGLLLMRYLNGWDITIPNPSAMDVSGDGKVDSLDGLLMMRYLNGWDVTLK